MKSQGYVASVLTSWFQADALIGGRFLKREAHIVMMVIYT